LAEGRLFAVTVAHSKLIKSTEQFLGQLSQIFRRQTTVSIESAAVRINLQQPVYCTKDGVTVAKEIELEDK
jgi:hypothetical protein